MPLTPEDVQNKRFTVVRFKFGYDEEEVDNFLDEIEEELRRLVSENKSLRQAATRAPSAPSPAAVLPPQPVAPPPPPPPIPQLPAVTGLGDTDDTALRTLMLAQRTAEDAIAKAHSDAEQILGGARAKATALEQELRAVHASRLAALERERAGLVEEIAALRGFEREFRSRLRTYLASSISDLDARPSVEPAPAQPVAAATAAAAAQSVGRHSADVPSTPLPSAQQPTAPQPSAPRPPAPQPPPGVPPVAPPASPPVAPPGPFSPAPPPAGPPAQA